MAISTSGGDHVGDYRDKDHFSQFHHCLVSFFSNFSIACSSFARELGWTGSPAKKRSTECCET